MKTITATAPSHWASYLINADASGLSAKEKAAVDAWVAREELGLPYDCCNEGFRWRHDAFVEFPLGADCQRYLFLTRD